MLFMHSSVTLRVEILFKYKLEINSLYNLKFEALYILEAIN